MTPQTRLTTILPLLFTALILAATSAHAESGAEILSNAGTTGGLVVHLGCGDGRLTAQLCADEQYLVHGLDSSAANVEQARRHIRSLGLYGRVSVEEFTPGRLPYADNLVNLLVIEDSSAVSRGEALRVLAPGGVAMIRRQEAGKSNA